MILVLFTVLFCCPLVQNKPHENILPKITVEPNNTTKEGELPISVSIGVSIDSINIYFEYILDSQKDNHAVYLDSDSAARMNLIRKKNTNGFCYDGSFLHSGFYYLFYPTYFERTLPVDKEILLYLIGEEEYIILKQSMQEFSGESYRSDISFRPSLQVLTIELFVHIDYSLYFRWLEFMGGDVNKALRGIKNFYKHVFHGVNDLYARINRADFSISTHVKRFYIQTTESLYGTVNKNDGSERVHIDPLTAIDTAIESFQTLTNPRDYDAAVYIAFIDMDGVVGVAYERTTCSSEGVALVSNLNQRDITQTMTHELAHTLGAAHDDEDDNGCSYSDKYIMTNDYSALNEGNLESMLKFSSCSITYIKLYLERLNSLDQNCMLNDASEASDMNDNALELVGQKYTLDEQCKLLIGEHSHYCHENKSMVETCYQLDCFDREYGSCRDGGTRTAADGTICGEDMWCYAGACVNSMIETQ